MDCKKRAEYDIAFETSGAAEVIASDRRSPITVVVRTVASPFMRRCPRCDDDSAVLTGETRRALLRLENSNVIKGTRCP